MSSAVALVDGLYRVSYGGVCAGFVVERGRVTACAPVLRGRIRFWMTRAELVLAADDFGGWDCA